MENAAYWIDELGLRPHPEGGWYRETYRAGESISGEALPTRYTGARSCSTAIYYLLRRGEVSLLHRLRSDELFHFHAGSPLVVHVIRPGGSLDALRLGPDASSGQVFQAAVPSGCWFGARVEAPGEFSLVGCTVAPGFDFADYEEADRAELTATFPRHRRIIRELTR